MTNEKRLIDANALKKAIRVESWKQIRMVQITLDFIDLIIGEQPTVDAVEVVHGYKVKRIVDHEYPWYTLLDCSECGCSVEIWHDYCPFCGARLDGDGNG